MPLPELKFLHAQRQKSSEKGAVMISETVDRKEQEKKEKRQSRVDLEQERKDKKRRKEEN